MCTTCFAEKRVICILTSRDGLCYACLQVLRDVLTILPMAPASTDDEDIRAVKPFGFVKWKAVLRGAQPPVHSTTAWGQTVAATLPTTSDLQGRYAAMLACGRSQGEDACLHLVDVLFLLEERGPRSHAQSRHFVQPLWGCGAGGKRRHGHNTRRRGEGRGHQSAILGHFRLLQGVMASKYT